jgi:hypothetical protein
LSLRHLSNNERLPSPPPAADLASPVAKAPPPLTAQTTPVQVSSVALAGDQRIVTFDVVNVAQKAVTAWQADVVVDRSRYIRGSDDYDNFERGRPATSYIFPVNRLSVTVPLRGTPSAASVPKVMLIGAIFTDGTFVGDARWATEYFSREQPSSQRGRSSCKSSATGSGA